MQTTRFKIPFVRKENRKATKMKERIYVDRKVFEPGASGTLSRSFATKLI